MVIAKNILRLSRPSLFSRPLPRHFTSTIRYSSSSSNLEQNLHATLLARPPYIIHDYLTSTSSHLLNLSLADFLPPVCYPPGFDASNPHLPGRYDETPVPQGHHLVYFSAQLPSSSLLADGTDTLHSPGAPFTRRLWGGGSLLFNPEKKYSLDLDGTRAVCIERITDVKVKGREGDEKVFVGLERRIGSIGRKLSDRGHDGFDEEWPLRMEERVKELESVSGGEELGGMDGLAVVERRELVFLRERAAGAAVKEARIVKPVHEPDYSITLTPNAQLLFRFSALTFNAHGIHLNPQYARDVEGYRNILVHGPLSLALVLSVLRSQLQPGEMIVRFDYRNLAPLFADEEMKICVKKDKATQHKWDVWVVGKEGGFAVKGSAIVGQADAPREDAL